jgi:hypothetical protein
MIRCIHGQVKVLDRGVGAVLAPFGEDLGGELARNGVAAQNAGVNMQ